jgi:hypothetical protein
MAKITYIVRSLALDGGVERIISEKMNYYADQLGYEVYVITCFQLIESQKTRSLYQRMFYKSISNFQYITNTNINIQRDFG